MINCPACRKEIGESLSGMATCPHCDEPLVPKHLQTEPPGDPELLGTAAMEVFEGVDAALFESIRKVAPHDAWPLSVMAEIVNFHMTGVSAFLNDAPDIRHSLIRLTSERRQSRRLWELFEEFVHVAADFQDILREDMPAAMASYSTSDLFSFHERFARAVKRLLEYHKQVACLRFVRDSLCHRMQALMLDWVQHVRLCFERLEKQMRRKSGFNTSRLEAMSVQATLVPPTISQFFNLMHELDG